MKFPVREVEFELCPEGSHVGICTKIIDMGTQTSIYKGKPKSQRKVYLEFEISGERKADGEPFWVGERYTFSDDERSRLRKDLECWRGKRFAKEELATFDLRVVLGQAAMLSIQHSESGYVDMVSVAALPKGTKPPETTTGLIWLSLEPDDFEPEVFDNLSEKMKEKIMASPQYQEIAFPESTGGF